MNKIDTYILKGVLCWLVIAQICASFIFLATQAFRLAPLFMGAQSPLMILQAFVWLQVPVWGWALGPAFIVAVFVHGGAMIQKGEFEAVDAAGIGRWRLARWPLVLSLLFSFVAATIWLFAAPVSQFHLERFSKGALADAVVDTLEPGAFGMPIHDVIFYADKKNDNDKTGIATFEGVFLERRDAGQLLVAKSATIGVSTAPLMAGDLSEYRFSIFLRDGELFDFKDDMAVLRFGELSVSVPLHEDGGQSLALLPPAMILSTSALYAGLHRRETTRFERFEFFRRFAKPVEFLLLAIVSCIFIFVNTWKQRRYSFLVALSLFLSVHLTSRFAEVWMQKGVLSPHAAAFLSSAIVCAILMVLLGRDFGRKSFKNGSKSL